MNLAYTKIPYTNFIVPTADENFLPKALEKGTILLEDSIANLKEVQELKDGDYVIDVGALYGDTALIFAERGAMVLGFEPQMDACIAAMWNTKQSRNIRIMNYAVGNDEKVIANDNPLNGNLGTRTLTKGDGDMRAVRLDDVIIFPPTMIKLDCEGFEYAALLGADKTIRTHKPKILCEIYPMMLEAQGHSKDDIYSFLTERGYQIRTCVGEEDSVRWDIMATAE